MLCPRRQQKKQVGNCWHKKRQPVQAAGTWNERQASALACALDRRDRSSHLPTNPLQPCRQTVVTENKYARFCQRYEPPAKLFLLLLASPAFHSVPRCLWRCCARKQPLPQREYFDKPRKLSLRERRTDPPRVRWRRNTPAPIARRLRD